MSCKYDNLEDISTRELMSMRRDTDYDQTKIRHILATREHIFAGDEAKTLRRLMAQNKMSKDEVLAIKRFRKEIAESGKQPQKYCFKCRRDIKITKLFLKGVLRKLKLPKEHPLVKQKFMEKVDKEGSRYHIGKNEFMSHFNRLIQG